MEEVVTSALRRKGTGLALRGCIWKADDGATSNAAGQHHSALPLILVCTRNRREISLKTLQQCLGTQQATAALCSTKCSSRCGNKQEGFGSQQRNKAALGYTDLSIVSSARRKRVGVFMHLPPWGGSG